MVKLRPGAHMRPVTPAEIEEIMFKKNNRISVDLFNVFSVLRVNNELKTVEFKIGIEQFYSVSIYIKTHVENILFFSQMRWLNKTFYPSVAAAAPYVKL